MIAVGRIGGRDDAVGAAHAVRERTIEGVLQRARSPEDNVCAAAERTEVALARAIRISDPIDRQRALRERVRRPKRGGDRD